MMTLRCSVLKLLLILRGQKSVDICTVEVAPVATIHRGLSVRRRRMMRVCAVVVLGVAGMGGRCVEGLAAKGPQGQWDHSIQVSTERWQTAQQKQLIDSTEHSRQ